MQSFGLILYNMSLWTFLYQRSMDLCCFFCPKVQPPPQATGVGPSRQLPNGPKVCPSGLLPAGLKLGGEEGRGGCMYYYFPKDKSVHSHHFSAGRTILEIRRGVDYFRPACSGLAKGHIPGLHILCVPRENSGKSRRLDANHMKRKRRLLNYV